MSDGETTNPKQTGFDSIFRRPYFAKFFTFDKYHLTGSSLVKDIEPQDEDWVISPEFLSKSYPQAVENQLLALGYIKSKHGDVDGEGDAYPNKQLFGCYRREKENIILPKTILDYENWAAFSNLLQYLQLKEKQQRVWLAQYMTEGGIRQCLANKMYEDALLYRTAPPTKAAIPTPFE